MLPSKPSGIKHLPRTNQLGNIEKAAISAAIMAYISSGEEASHGKQTLEMIQVGRWGFAGRMEVMDLRLRR